MAGEKFERQEVAICKAVEEAVEKNNKEPVTLYTYEATLSGVLAASKYSERIGGKEPYTDLVFICDGGIQFNVSCKGESAPSLAGGGLRGIEAAVPGLAPRFVNAAHDYLLSRYGAGMEIPNIYGRVSDEDKIKIAAGNKYMGGPIDFMYIGSMTVEWLYEGSTLKLNGRLIPTATFATSRDFFFRIRARRHDQRFEPNLLDRYGVPRIYGRSPSKRDIGHRLVVCDSSTIPKDAIVIEFDKDNNEIQAVHDRILQTESQVGTS